MFFISLVFNLETSRAKKNRTWFLWLYFLAAFSLLSCKTLITPYLWQYLCNTYAILMTMVSNIIKERRILKIGFLFSFQKQMSRQSQWAMSVWKGRYLEGETLYLEWNSVSKYWLGTYYMPGAGQTPVTHDRSLPSRNASSGVRGRHIIKWLLK